MILAVTSCTTAENKNADSSAAKTSQSNTEDSFELSDNEIIEAGREKMSELQELYQNYLQYGYSNLAIEIDLYDIKKLSVTQDGYSKICYFNRVSSGQTYKDIENEFQAICTPELCEKLLTETTHVYSEIDGELYLCWVDGTINYKNSTIDSFIVDGDTITYNCTSISDVFYGEEAGTNEVTFTFSIKNIEGVLYISDYDNIAAFVL